MVYQIVWRSGEASRVQVVDGQLRGGVAQSVGGALQEEFGYDEDGVSVAGAGIENAVRDALGLTGTVGQLPLTPSRILGLVYG
jgi:CO/xanthine dehydrogenase Mo-binding subunit